MKIDSLFRLLEQGKEHRETLSASMTNEAPLPNFHHFPAMLLCYESINRFIHPLHEVLASGVETVAMLWSHPLILTRRLIYDSMAQQIYCET